MCVTVRRETTTSGLEHPHPIPHFNKIVLSQTPRFSCEITISGPDNVRPHVFRARLQYQAPNMTPTISDATLFVRDYNIRPRQCQTPRISRETILSGPEHDSDPTLFVRDYNIRPRQSQTPRFSCETKIMIRNPRTFASRPKIHFSGNLSAAHIYEPTYQPLEGVYLFD